ncbi:MAG: MarR family winged helix-turn-helix transcriptional regulator [Myxococcales bacterium]|nr:MarR family winged helix-turn-helix transcriptional regulator [Myxococcales bacterium]
MTHPDPSAHAVDELVALCHLFGALERDAICGGSVTVPQCATLQELLTGAKDVSTLAASARVSKSAMTRLLDGLVKRELVVRGRDEDDRRRVIVALTEAGQVEAQRLRRCTEELVEGILQQLPAEEREGASRALALVRRAAQALLDDPPSCGPRDVPSARQS